MVQKAPHGQCSEMVSITELLSVTTFRIITKVAFGSEMTREERLYFAEHTNNLIGEMLLDFVGYPVRQCFTIFGARKRLFESKRKVDQVCKMFIERRLQETKEQKESRPEDLLDAILSLKDHDMTSITSQTVAIAAAGAHTLYETIA